MRTTSIATLATALLLSSVALGCGAENALVDRHCRDGFTKVDGHCVSSEIAAVDPRSEDAGNVGPSTETADEAALDAKSDGITRRFGSAPSEAVIVPSGTPEAEDASAPLVCTAPEFACRGACITGDSDPQNCGACGKICPSNICVAGQCQGATPGDVVAIGHDYGSSWNGSAQLKVLVNAVTIATTDPIRVLAFDGDTAAAAADGTRKLVASAIKGRSIVFTHAEDGAALESNELARDYDVVLIHAALASDPTLGTRVAPSFDAFTKKGGIVVALDNGSSPVPALLRDSGALAVTDHALLSSSAKVVVSAPGDVVGVQVVSPYAPTGASVGFIGIASAPEISVVVDDETGSGLPVVVHRTVR